MYYTCISKDKYYELIIHKYTLLSMYAKGREMYILLRSNAIALHGNAKTLRSKVVLFSSNAKIFRSHEMTLRGVGWRV